MVSFLPCLVLLLGSLYYSSANNATLRHVQLFFRHGERTPTVYLSFPTEQHPAPVNFEVGEMTNKGLQQEYLLGQYLRTLYGELLGEHYRSREISALSGRDNRTSASAQLLLAGLFPPHGDQIWNRDLLWQPIPVQTVRIIDHASFGLFDDCPAETDRMEHSSEYARVWTSFGTLVKELSQKTGLDIPNLKILQKVTDAIVTRANLPDLLPLPAWASSDAFVARIRQDRTRMHQQVIDMTLDKLGGWHFDHLIGRMDDVVNGWTPRQKAVFYSAHDTNIMTLGRYLNIPTINDTFFGYAGFIAVELHQNGHGDYYVELKGRSDLNGTLSALLIPECPEPCAFSRFRTLRSRTTTAEWMSRCLGTPSDGCSFYASVAAVLTIVLVVLLGLMLSML